MVSPAVMNGTRSDLRRFMDDFFGDFNPWPAHAAPRSPMAVWDDAQHVYLEIDLPGVASENVDLTVNDGKLTVSWERKAPEGERGFDERTYGQHQRVLGLPKTVDTEAVNADLKDGVLKIRFNKRAELQPRKIEIKAS